MKKYCQSLLWEAYSFTATKENPSLLWKLAAISSDKINENIQVPIPKHAWQKHVLSFPVILHLSTLRTICLHRFLLLFSSRTEPVSSKKLPKLFQKTLFIFILYPLWWYDWCSSFQRFSMRPSHTSYYSD